MSGQLSLRDFLLVEERLFTEEPRGWVKWDAGPKLILTIGAIAANVILAKIRISLALFVSAVIILIASRVPIRQALIFLLAPAWATILVVVGMSAGFGHTPLFQIGSILFTVEGLKEGLSAAARVGCDMAWMAALCLTTPISDILRALKRGRVPDVLLDTLAFMYRYVFLLWDEFVRMKTAAKARGGFSSKRRSFESISRISAQVLLGAYDRASQIHVSIQARGGAVR